MTNSEIPALRAVRRVSPVAPYVGGKKNLALRIIERLEGIPHAAYAEPFVGMGGVFLRRRLAPKAEAINDANRDVANLFRILQRHYDAFIDLMRFQLSTRVDFERFKATPPDTLTDLERAARFLYLQRQSFGGHVTGQNFAVERFGGSRYNLPRLAVLLEEVHARLASVTIECLPWRRFIERYDRPETLFYLDPPYWGCEDYYGAAFARAEFEDLAEVLDGLKGQFVMSLNDLAEVRRIFRRFAIEAVPVPYRLSGRVTEAKEVLITAR